MKIKFMTAVLDEFLREQARIQKTETQKSVNETGEN